MNIKLVGFTAVLSLVLSACTVQQPPSKQSIGAVIGGALGGIAGSQVGGGKGRVAATIGGTLIGALIGGSIGNTMDVSDQQQAVRALENTPTGQKVAWKNPDTQAEYQVTPIKTYDTNTGPCREYETVAIINGQREVLYGTACRQPDGSWKSK